MSETTQIFLYIITQTVCVLSSTIKSVVTIKGTKLAATLISTLHYVINALIIYLVGKMTNIWIILSVTAITNLIGVYAGLVIVDKFRKDQLWRISATVKVEFYADLISELKAYKFKFVTFETSWDKVKLLDIFSEGKEQSSILHMLVEKYNLKYTINNCHYKL